MERRVERRAYRRFADHRLAYQHHTVAHLERLIQLNTLEDELGRRLQQGLTALHLDARSQRYVYTRSAERDNRAARALLLLPLSIPHHPAARRAPDGRLDLRVRHLEERLRVGIARCGRLLLLILRLGAVGEEVLRDALENGQVGRHDLGSVAVDESSEGDAHLRAGRVLTLELPSGDDDRLDRSHTKVIVVLRRELLRQ